MEEEVILTCQVVPDEFTDYLSNSFDYSFEGKSSFQLPQFDYPEDFNIGLIVGSSGSGKSQILKHHFGFTEEEVDWNRDKAIISHFETPEIGVKKLMACGLASLPSLCKPYHVLSNGEQFRASVARKLEDGAIIDEYTSVVNRETAISLSVALSKYVRENNIKGMVIASVHRDIVEWLQPDWIFDCDYLELNHVEFENRRRVATIEIE